MRAVILDTGPLGILVNPRTTIATTNVKHLSQFCSAEPWKDITP